MTSIIINEISDGMTNDLAGSMQPKQVESDDGVKYEKGLLSNVWESTKKFLSFSASHHTKMLNIIKADGKGSINPVKIIKFRINPFRKVDIAKPSVIFGNIRGKILPLYLKPRIERLQNFKLDGLKDKKLQKIFGRDFNKIEEVKHRYKGLAGEALWEKLAENDPEAYRQLMLEQSGLRGGRYIAETIQNGIKLATLGIAGYTALSGGLAVGAGMLIGSRLLAMVSYPMGQAFTNYYDKLAGRGYSTAEKVQAMVVNLPTAIIGGILGYKAAEIIGSASSEILSKITNSNTVRYGLNTLSRILLMAGSGAATNIVSGILQSRAYQVLISKAEVAGDNEKKEKLERMKKISNAVGTMMNPLVSSLGALSASIPETMESIQHQIESFENANTFDPSETISNTNKLAENNNQPIGGLAPGMQMLNPLGNSDLGPTQVGTQTRLFTELNGSAGGGVQNQGVGGRGGLDLGLDITEPTSPAPTGYTYVSGSSSGNVLGLNYLSETGTNANTTQQLPIVQNSNGDQFVLLNGTPTPITNSTLDGQEVVFINTTNSGIQGGVVQQIYSSDSGEFAGYRITSGNNVAIVKFINDSLGNQSVLISDSVGNETTISINEYTTILNGARSPFDFLQPPTQTQSTIPQPVDLNLESYITNGPTEWRTAAGLVEESINYIRTTNNNADVRAVFLQIGIDLNDTQINAIKAGTISEETINELLRASVVMQQGSKLYPNGSAGSIFSNFIDRANAENGGEVLDGYARLNDAPIDNPYKTVEGILITNKSDIETNLATLASASNLSNTANTTGTNLPTNGAAGGIDNTLNVDLAGFDAMPVDTLVTDTGTNGQFNGFGSIERLANFQRSILASTELSTEQKTQLLQFSRDLAENTDGGVLAQSINQFFGGKEFSPTELLPVLRKAQDHGFYNPLENDVRNRVKPAITVQEYANAPKGDFKRNWGASDVVKENYIQLEGDNTKLSLYDILKESYDRGNFYNDDLDWVPQEWIDIYKDQVAYLNQTWNGLPAWAQVGIGLGAVVFLLREGNLRFMPYEMLPKWAKRTRVRRWVRRRNIPQDKKEELLNGVDHLIDTNGSLKRGDWKIKQREIKKAEREYTKKYGGSRGMALFNRGPVRFLRARLTGTRTRSRELVEKFNELNNKKIEEIQAKARSEMEGKSTDEKKAIAAKYQDQLIPLQEKKDIYNSMLEKKGFLNRKVMKEIRRELNQGEVEKISDKIKRVKDLKKYWPELRKARAGDAGLERGITPLDIFIPDFAAQNNPNAADIRAQIRGLNRLKERIENGKESATDNRFKFRVGRIDRMIERLERFENRDKAFEKYVDLVKGMLNNTNPHEQFDQFDFGIDAIETLKNDIQNGDVKEEEVEDRLKAIAVPLEKKRYERITNLVAKDDINAAVNKIQDDPENTEFIDEIRTLREELDKKIEKGYVNLRKAVEEMNDIVERAKLLHMRRVNKGRLPAGIKMPLEEDRKALRIGNPLNIRRQRQRLVNKKIKGEELTEDEKDKLVELEQRLEERYRNIQDKKKQSAEVEENKEKAGDKLKEFEDSLVGQDYNPYIDQEALKNLRAQVKKGELNEAQAQAKIDELTTKATADKSEVDRQQNDDDLKKAVALYTRYAQYVELEVVNILDKFRNRRVLTDDEETRLRGISKDITTEEENLRKEKDIVDANKALAQPIFEAFKTAITEEDHKYLNEGEVDSIQEMVNQGMSRTDVDNRIAQIRRDLAQRKTEDTTIKADLYNLDAEINALDSSKKSTVFADGVFDRRTLGRERYETLRKEIEEARRRNDYVRAKAKLAQLQDLVKGRQEQYDRRKTKQDNKKKERAAKEAQKKAVIEGKNNTVQSNKAELEKRRDLEKGRIDKINRDDLNQEQVAEYDKVAVLMAEVEAINLNRGRGWRVQKHLYNRKLNAIREKINVLENNIKDSSST